MGALIVFRYQTIKKREASITELSLRYAKL